MMLNGLGKLTVTEAKLVLRDRVPVLITLGFPLLILVLFGSISAGNGDTTLAAYFPSMAIALSVGVLGVNVLPSYLAGYREKGVLRRLAVTPVSPVKLLFAQLAVNAGLGVLTAGLVLGVGSAAFGYPAPAQVLGSLVAFLLGMVALFSVGLFVAAVAPSGRAASAIGTVLWLLSMFFGGVMTPKETMPAALARIGDFTPLGAMVQGLRDTWTGHWPQPLHLVVLAGVAVVFGSAAARLFRWV